MTFAQRQISQRGRRLYGQPREKPWVRKFRNARPGRVTVEDICRYICTQSGFCGGPGYAPDLIAQMTSINAADFAWAVLEAEGMAETFEYDTSWRPYFEAMFMDIFGDGDVDLDG